MENLKSNAVLYLTQEKGADRDVEAAKLLARCDVERRPLPPDRAEEPTSDVLVHSDAETINEIRKRDFAPRIERAIRTVGETIRQLQWVEDGRSTGPRNQLAGGDGGDMNPVGQPKEPGPPPRFEHNGPGPLGPPTSRGANTGPTGPTGSGSLSHPLSCAFPRTLMGEGTLNATHT
ncbi:MAG: hypothetical protein ACIAQ0_14370 [Phycisphaerales bacterium JB058]